MSEEEKIDREWFTVRTKVHNETLAKGQYLRQGFTVYLPITQKNRRHARRIDTVIRPFFPGYLFLHLAPAERNWITIRSTIGSIGAVHFGDCYPPVPDWVIESLRERENQSGVIDTRDIELAWLQKGTKVKVVCGELEGLEGMFLEMKGEDRAVVFLEFLKRQVATTLLLSCLQAT